MLSSIRAFAKTWFAKVLFVLIMVSFLAIGARTSVNTVIASDNVVQAGSRHITTTQFKNAFDNDLRQLDQQYGQLISPADAVANGFDKRVLQDLSNEESEMAYLARSGLRPSDQLVADALHEHRDFFDPVSGRFDPVAYRRWLADRELTVQEYEGRLRDQITHEHLEDGLAAGLRAPAVYGALIAAYELENRTISYFVIDPRYIPPVQPPTDADLQTYIKQQHLMLPELRTLTVIRFSAKALAPAMPVDQAAVQKLFDFRKTAASAPEKRTLVELPTKDAASAAAASRRLRAGETPTAVAKSLGLEPIAYAEQPKSAIADPKVADVAFGLKSGEVSDPIQGAIAGVPVVVVQSVEPARVADINAMRPALEAQARVDAAGQKVYDEVQKFQDVHGGGASLADAAKAAGVVPVTIGPIRPTGADAYGQPPGPGLTPKLLREAFSLSRGGETDVEDDGAGEYFLVRVDAISPSAPPSLLDPKMRQTITGGYMRDTTYQRLQAKADELTAQVRKGASLNAVAGSVSASVQSASMTQLGMSKDQALSPALLGKIFSAKAGEVFDGQKADGAYMIAHMDSIQPVAPGAGAPWAARATQGQARALFEDMGQAVSASAFAAIKPRVYPDRALMALNINPADRPKPGSISKGGGAAP